MLLPHVSCAEVAILKTMVLACSLSAFVAIGALGAEVPVSQPAYGPAPGNQYDAAVASDGDQYLVVWADERSEVPQAFAARVSRDGTVLDPNGIRVASGALTSHPHVIWGGSCWFVLSNTGSGFELVRVAGNGAVLDAKPRVFSPPRWTTGLSVATDGHHVAVGYVAGQSTYEQHVLILNGDGESTADIRLSGGETYAVVPAIAWNGSFFVAVWQGFAVPFDANGTVAPARGVAVFGSPAPMHIASDGHDFIVIRGPNAFRMSADLVAEFLMTLPLDVSSIAWTGSSYVIAGVVKRTENGQLHQSDVNLVRLDREGHLLAQREVLRAEGNGEHRLNSAAVATNGQNLLVAWHDSTDARDAAYLDTDTFASIVSLPELTPEPRKLLSVAADWQIAPSTAASGSTDLTVWQEATGLYARRHRRDGGINDSPIRLAEQATSVAVAFNGSDFIVASTEGAAIVTRRLPATGALRVDREWRFDGGKNPRAIALASSGAATMVAWLDGGIHAARVGVDGSLIDQVPLEVAPAQLARETQRVAISPNGDGEFLVVWGGSIPACWYCSPSSPPFGGVLRAARVTSTLTLLDHPPIEIAIPVPLFDSRSDPASLRYDPRHSLFADDPSVTWNGNEWLVVWNREFRDAVIGEFSLLEEIRGRRIARNGTLLDGSPGDPGVLMARSAFAPTVAWTGSGYLLGWYEGSPTYRSGDPSRLQQIHAASLDRLGGPLSNERTLGESPDADPISMAVANGLASMAYARLGDASRYGGVSRAFLEVPGFDTRRRAAGR
jgi:hypothetical protein